MKVQTIITLTLMVECIILITAGPISKYNPREATPIPRKLEQSVVFLKETQPLLISASSWTIGLDIPIDNYAHMLQDFKLNVNSISKTIAFNISAINTTGISDFVQIINHETQLITTRSEAVLDKLAGILATLAPEQTPRAKRSPFNGIGYGLKMLFGTLSDSDLETINGKLDELKSNDADIAHLVDSQLSLLNTTYFTANKNARDVRLITRAVAKLDDRINEAIEATTAALHNTKLIVILMARINSLLRSYESMINTIEIEIDSFATAIIQTSFGKLSPHFMTPKALVKSLKEIEAHLMTGTEMITPIKENLIYRYYEIASVRAGVINNRLRLFINIPLSTNDRTFDLYKIVSLPVYTNNYSTAIAIQAGTDYLAITRNRQLYFELTTNELQSCTNNLINICHPFKEIIKPPISTCSFALFNSNKEEIVKLCQSKVMIQFQPAFIRSPTSNLWLYSVNRMKFISHCMNRLTSLEDNISEITLQGTGIIQLNRNCRLYNEFYLLDHHTTHIEYSNTTLHVPENNNLINFLNDPREDDATSPSPSRQNDIKTLLATIRAEPFHPPSLPIAEWHEQLRIIESKTWKTSDHLPYTATSTFLILAVAASLLIWQRNRVIALCTKPSPNTLDTLTSNTGAINSPPTAVGQTVTAGTSATNSSQVPQNRRFLA